MNLLDLARSAIAKQPAPNGVAAPAQAADLRELIALVLAGDSEADRAEALAVALTDPDAALVSFRALAADL